MTALTYKQGATVLGTLTYTYDAAGNRTQLGGTWARTGLPQSVASATYNAANHQLTFGSQTLTHDLNGNLTSDGTNTYTWNARNQLIAINGTGLTASFSYDGLGRRRTKTINSTGTDFVYDGLNPVQELSGGSVVANLLTGLAIDEFFTRTDGAASRSLLTDALGSTVALTDGTGAVQTEYTYEPFGRTTIAGAANANSFQYTGRENDGTGLYYYRARYYHPTLQRFLSEDPILAPLIPSDLGFAGNLYHPRWMVPWLLQFQELLSTQLFNQYAYTQNNPLIMRDPYGLFGTCDAICAFGCVLGCYGLLKHPGARLLCSVICAFICAGACPDVGEPACPPPPPCPGGRKGCSPGAAGGPSGGAGGPPG